jgi:hypothetical protein
MSPLRVLALFASLNPALAFADSIEWQRYVVPSTGANVDVPVSIFTEDAGPPEGGIGKRFFTKDRRADLTVQSILIPRMTPLPTFWRSGSRQRAYSTEG